MGHYDEQLAAIDAKRRKKRIELISTKDNNTLDDILGFDNVNHPKHYTSHKSGIECIQITEHMGFCLGNAIKYIWRCKDKNGIEDLEKSIWYIQREIARLKSIKE